MKRLSLLAVTIALIFAMTNSAVAALVNRGGGLIYDTDLNVTWLQDANYAMTSGYDADGSMFNDQAYNFIAYLNSSNFLGHSNWRLPKVDSPCVGYDCTNSEMGHLYYMELGNTSAGATNSGPFINLCFNLACTYWTDTPCSPGSAYVFGFAYGSQGCSATSRDFGNVWRVMVVRDGDVIPIPCSTDADCNDDLFCNGTETCPNGNICVEGTNPCPGQKCDETQDKCVECLSNADCDDGVFCNGTETCSNGNCVEGTNPCPGQNCDETQDKCVACETVTFNFTGTVNYVYGTPFNLEPSPSDNDQVTGSFTYDTCLPLLYQPDPGYADYGTSSYTPDCEMSAEIAGHTFQSKGTCSIVIVISIPGFYRGASIAGLYYNPLLVDEALQNQECHMDFSLYDPYGGALDSTALPSNLGGFYYQEGHVYDSVSGYVRFSIDTIEKAPHTVNDLIALVNSMNLKLSVTNSLLSYLKDASFQLGKAKPNVKGACSDLSDFISLVNAQTGKKITAAQASELVAAAEQIKTALSCK